MLARTSLSAYGAAVIATAAVATISRGRSQKTGGEAELRPPSIVHVHSPVPARKAAMVDSSFRTGPDLLADFHSVRRADLPNVAAKDTVDVLIVTMPDPFGSHLDWAYDAGLESVRRAFEISDFLIDRFWLPWSAGKDSTGSRSLRLAAAQTHPGVLLFRSKDASSRQIRLVYVVGEVPTVGVHKYALRAALGARRQLLQSGVTWSARGRDVIRLAGPVFSGSAVSLRQTIQQWRDSTHDGTRIEIVTGSASDPSLSKTLNDTTLRATFTATVHSSAWLQSAADSIIGSRLGIKPSQIAFLHEGTTQYGAAAGDSTRRGGVEQLTISFPSNISSLRTEYARHPLPQTTSGQQIPADAPRLPLDLREPADQTENPSVVSDLTAPSVEILLAEVEKTLLAHRIRAVGIVATDVRDQLFIADELRKRLRDVQLFFYGSNALLLRADYRQALVGSLVLSTYPLFLENEYWDLTKRDRQRFAFTSDETEGLFNAVLYQLGKASLMIEYGMPLDMRRDSSVARRPPIWVTVVGRDAMYPLTFVSERAPTSSGAPTGESSLADRYQLERHAIRVKPFAEGGRTTWEFVASLIVLSIGFVVSFLLIQRRTPRRVDVLVASAADRRAKRRAETPEERLRLQRAVAWVLLLFQRELYVVLRYFALFGAFSSLALLIFRPRAHGVPIDSWWFLLSIPLMLITVIVGQRAIVQSGRVVRLGFGPGKRYLLRVSSSTWRDQILWIIELASRLVLLLFGVGYFVVSMTWLVEVLNFDPPLSAVFFERATAIGSGLSPALPLILSGLGFAMWASWHLTRISLLSEPTVYEDYLLQEDFEDSGRRQLLQNAKTSAREAERYSREAVRIALRAVTTHARAGGNGGNGNGNGAKEQPQIFRRAAAAMDLAERNVKKAEKAAFDADSRTPLDAPKRERETHADELRERHRLVADAWRATSAAKRTLDEVKREFSASSERQTLAVAERDEELSSIGLGDGQERARETAEYKSIIDEEDQARPNFVRALRRAHERFHAWIDRLHDSEDPSPHASNAARAIHEGLFYLVPGVPAIFFLVLLGLTAVWLLLQFESSFESAVLIRRTAFFGLSAFDWLFRFGLLATLGAIAWAVYRFLLIWRGLRRLLATLDPSFKSAFSGLPEEFKRLTRLTPFGAPSRASVEEAVTTHWREMRRIYASNEAAFIDTPAVAISGSTNVAMGPPRMRARPYELNPYLSDEFGFFARSVERFKRVDIPDTANAAIKRGISPYQPDTMEMFRTARVNWADSSTSLLAVYVADYVEWVFQHLRYLAVFLLVSLVLTMVFLSVYPFQPQGVIKAVFFVEAGVAIASIIAILFQMNRDATLSAITRGNANVIDWNRQFVGSLLTYGAVPVLTFISTEFPVVRDFLFSWVSPLLRAFGRS